MKLLWVGIGLGTLVFMFAAMTQSEPEILMQEDFDADPDAGLAKALLEDPEISFAKGGGPDGSDAIRVAYVGYERGSHRVTTIYNLLRTCNAATLSYDVRFDEGFQFDRIRQEGGSVEAGCSNGQPSQGARA